MRIKEGWKIRKCIEIEESDRDKVVLENEKEYFIDKIWKLGKQLFFRG
jgi:hypothetical protein